MATSSDIFCGPCETQHLTKCADHWCPECEEGLCSVCQKHHSASKATRKHNIITIDSYKRIPNFVLKISDTCKEHEMKFNMYCPHHDAICCLLCISLDHSKCTDLKAISQITKHAKSSALFSSMDMKLREMMTFLDTVVKNVNDNESTIKQKRLMLTNEMKTLRTKINTHLDVLEENINRELNDAEKKANSHLENVKIQICVEIEKCKELREGLVAIKENGSDLQAFYGGKKIKSEVEKEEKLLQSMSEDDTLKEKHIDCRIDDKISNILSLKSFGTITTTAGHPLGIFTVVKDILGQTVSGIYQSSPRSFDDLTLTLQSTISIPGGDRQHIRGCHVSGDGKLLFCDWLNKDIIIFTPGESFEKKIQVSTPPNNVTLINEITAAVSTDDGINIIDINSAAITQVINCSKSCYGIAYNDGSLYWCEMAKGIQTMQLSTRNISTLIKQPSLPPFSYITILGDKIYQTNGKTVTCYTLHGQIQWNFELNSGDNDSNRIAVDNDSHVYVTSYHDNNVILISSDGKQYRQLLGVKDGLKHPTGIHFDKIRHNVLISNLKESAFVFRFT